MGFLYDQLCASYRGHIPYVHMYRPSEGSKADNRNVETQLWYVPYAYILARIMGNGVQANFGIADCCRHTQHCCEYFRQLLCNDKDSFVLTR